MSLEHKILHKIEQEGIRPRSRWFFYGKDGAQFAMALIFLGAASLFFGISIALIFHLAREISFVNFPYGLVVLCALTAYIAYESFVHSFSFYKMQLSLGILLLSILTFSIGYALFSFGHAERLERRFRHSSAYRQAVPYSFSEDERFEERD
jgi:hypothetical protein